MSSVNRIPRRHKHLPCVQLLEFSSLQAHFSAKLEMRAFVVLACVAMAMARPEPPSGYSYSAPAPRYSAPSSNYGAPSLGGHSSGSFGGHSSGSLSLGGHSGHSLGGHSSGGLSLGHSSGGLSSFGGDSGFGGGYAGGYSGAPQVQKHIYVHVPPQEHEEYRAPRIPSVAPPQKHYKIIFIKAPTAPTPTAPIIPVQPQNEEKTLVYVLVKKPEDQPDIVIPTPAPTQPAKPEVYFIKYQTQKDGGASSGLSGGDLSGAGLSGAGLSGAGLSGAGLSGGDLSGGSLSGAGHGSGAELGGDYSSGSGAEEADAGIAGNAQYGPPGHVAGPLH